MKIAIFGANGLLGNYICRYFRHASLDILPITRAEFDIYAKYTKSTLVNDLRSLLQSEDVKWVVNCAGVINKRPDLSTEEMVIVNAYFPIILGSICEENNIQLIHPTTDCVFSGAKGNYTSADIADCADIYGISKYLGEKIPGTPIIIRASIIGQDSQNRSLLSWCLSQKNQTVHGYTNHFWNGITCLEYAKILEKVIRGQLVIPTGKPFHISCKNVVSKCELIRYISDIYKLNLNIIPTEVVDKVDRSLTPDMVTSEIQDQIRETREFDLNIFRTPAQYKISGDDILMMSSCIIAYSAFTPEERYQQTLLGIESVRKYLPSCKIVLIENSAICEEWIENLANKCEYLILCAGDTEIQRLNHHGLSSALSVSPGELAQTIEIARHLDKPKHLFKLSGRYQITEKTHINDFDPGKFNFRETVGDTEKSYHTTFYGLPVDIPFLVEYLQKCMNTIMTSPYIELEITYARTIAEKDIKFITELGCCGFVSGRYDGTTRTYFYQA